MPEWQRWLEQAKVDLSVAELTLREGYYAETAFKSQQVAEKALKAFLHFQNVRDPWGHSCLDLLQWSGKFDRALLALDNDARALDKHYIASRYPNGLPSGYPHSAYGKDEVAELLTKGRRILQAIAQRVEPA